MTAPAWAERLQQQLDRLGGAPPSALEAEAVEFREWASDGGEEPRRLRESIVAFANADGGVILLGAGGGSGDDRAAEAAGAFARLNGNELRRDVYDGTDPKILVETAELRAAGARLLAIRIPRGLLVHTTAEGDARIR